MVQEEQIINLALVVHNHQPYGNRDEIIERIYKQSYLPFLEVLNDHPQVNLNLHYTGFLLDWFDAHHPEAVDLVRRMVDRGQVELVGGAYYEPVISVIPNADALGQTSLLSEKIRSLFGTEAKGFWTAERAWEPYLPEVLEKAGATHTFIDDISFQSAGVDESALFQAYLVESRGSFVSVFPIIKKLRYLIPFKPVSSTISYLKKIVGSPIAVYADDGEKFGAWPNTYEQVFRDRWLVSFFNEISRARWIRTVKVSEYLRKNPPKRRIYLPASAYSEMMEWSIPFFPGNRNGSGSKSQTAIPHRGFWRLFLAKYPESARLYSKMLRVSSLLHSAEDPNGAARLDLWKGQCNDAYWHGVFGGLYAPILRRITYENLIRAQVGFEKSLKYGSAAWIGVNEISHAGFHGIEVNSESLGIVISPAEGGAISEADYKPRFVNVLDTLARRPERYHAEVRRQSNRTIVPRKKKAKIESIHSSPKARQSGLKELLVYDRHPKFAFLDYIVPFETTPDNFAGQNYRERLPLASLSYEAEIQKSNEAARTMLRLETFDKKGKEKFEIEKGITIPVKESMLTVSYQVKASGRSDSSRFISEVNLGCLSDSSFEKEFDKPKIVKGDRIEIAYREAGMKATLEFQGAISCWVLPVRTVSLSEDGFESNLQGISVLPGYEVGPGETETLRASLQLGFRPI